MPNANEGLRYNQHQRKLKIELAGHGVETIVSWGDLEDRAHFVERVVVPAVAQLLVSVKRDQPW